MNTSQLLESIRAANIDERFVSLGGEVKDGSLVLERGIGMGWCVYYRERGQRADERYFITEEEACPYIFELLVRDPNARKHA